VPKAVAEFLVEFNADNSTRPELDAAVESAILAYLAERPESCDTLRGIAEWWIVQYTVRFGVETVAAALERLAEAGALERLDTNPEPLYRLKPAASGAD
jgi:hypothetical protein